MPNGEILISVTKDDFRIDTFKAGGNGGQNQNSRDTGVRITHIASGASAEARDSRSQEQNKRAAFRRCVHSPKFQVWLKKQIDSDYEFEPVTEVIRTYNYPRGTVKDNRSGEKFPLDLFMEGKRC